MGDYEEITFTLHPSFFSLQVSPIAIKEIIPMLD